MDAPGHDTNDYWTLKHKVHDLIDNGTVVVAPLATQNINTNPIPFYAPGPSSPPIHMISTDDLLFDPSPLSTTIHITTKGSNSPLVAPINNSTSNPFIIGASTPYP